MRPAQGKEDAKCARAADEIPMGRSTDNGANARRRGGFNL
jgi:hypothetical protein